MHIHERSEVLGLWSDLRCEMQTFFELAVRVGAGPAHVNKGHLDTHRLYYTFYKNIITGHFPKQFRSPIN